MADNYEYDVFISYAVEDKIEIVTELVGQLKNSGLKVWYAGQELRVGKSIEEVIKEGLNKSRYGVVILTHNYFTKDWPRKELHALWGKNDSLIIPIWHKLSTEDVKKYDPLLADKWGIESSKGIDIVAAEVIKAIENHKKEGLVNRIAVQKSVKSGFSFKNILTALSILILAAISLWFFVIRDLPGNNLIKETVESRIDVLQAKVINDHGAEMSKQNGEAATIEQVAKYHERYESFKSQYRNEYYFKTGYADFSFKKNVEPALGIEIDHLTPRNNFGFTYPNIFVIDYLPSPHKMDVKTIFINTQPIEYTILNEEKIDDTTYTVEVSYKNNIRYLSIDLTYSKRSDWIKKREYHFQGFLPFETYQFKKEDDKWVFTAVL
ncbi:MAG: toll/interleukin-1 receptor domain-containing protein [Fulvivirga sp.]|uniref:toll/interleukin-1 receptor domain-containing protein n=1 Tax=Fulvivirga sp. TaxID=1931237 RepID=UPI0032EC54F9